MIRINLTGDYALPEGSSSTASSELAELDAFLGALRGSVSADRDTFLKAIADLTKNVKRTRLTNVAIQISSTLNDGVLTHDFRIVKV